MLHYRQVVYQGALARSTGFFCLMYATQPSVMAIKPSTMTGGGELGAQQVDHSAAEPSQGLSASGVW